MAGNSAIQILRGTSANIVAQNSSQTLLDGQPLYNTDKNYLTIGGGGNNLTKKPIAVRELVAYDGDTDTTIGSNITEMASIRYNSNNASLNISSVQGYVNVRGIGANINIGTGDISSNTASLHVNAETFAIVNVGQSLTIDAGDFSVINNTNSSACIHFNGNNLDLKASNFNLAALGLNATIYANPGPIKIIASGTNSIFGTGSITLNAPTTSLISNTYYNPRSNVESVVALNISGVSITSTYTNSPLGPGSSLKLLPGGTIDIQASTVWINTSSGRKPVGKQIYEKAIQFSNASTYSNFAQVTILTTDGSFPTTLSALTDFLREGAASDSNCYYPAIGKYGSTPIQGVQVSTQNNNICCYGNNLTASPLMIVSSGSGYMRQVHSRVVN